MFIPMRQIDNTTRQLLRDPQKRRAWIHYQIGLLGLSVAEVGRQAGVSRQCIYQAFRKPYPRMEAILAEALDMPVQDLFPERYTADGLPARAMGRPRKAISMNREDTSGSGVRNVNAGSVA